MTSTPEGSVPDFPRRRSPGATDPSDFAAAVDRFTHTLRQLRKNELSDVECAALRSLLEQLLRIARRGLMAAVVMSTALTSWATVVLYSLA
jgi:hypothetical protein